MSAIRNVNDVLQRQLYDGRARGRDGFGEFDPSLLFNFLLAALDKLIQCRPDPAAAWEWLAWRPYWWEPFSAWRLARHRRQVRAALGADVRSRVFLDLVFDAVDEGRVGPRNLPAMYAERGAA